LAVLSTVLTAAAVQAAPTDETRTADYWREQGSATLKAALATHPNTRKAKKVILFVGDGNGVASVTATRIFDGQSRGQPGEENILSYERFPYVALSKTYNTNQQVPDSAGTMTAMMTGVKTRDGVISVAPEQPAGVCE